MRLVSASRHFSEYLGLASGGCRTRLNSAQRFVPHFVLAPFRRHADRLLYHSCLGSPVFGPGGVVVPGVCRHFQTKAHGLNS
jgi:hypothetical protein